MGNQETTLNKSWALDREITNVIKEKGLRNQIIESSIQSELDKLNLQAVGKNQQTNFDSPYRSETDEEINFSTPPIDEKYILQRKLNYSSYTQRWIGSIIEIKDDTFTARLDDIIDPTTYEIGEFDINDVVDDDKNYITLGAVFYWSLGYSYINGQYIKGQQLRFQRISSWHTEDIDEIEDRADFLLKNIEWE